MERLGGVVKDLEISGADCIHFDIADGSFVPVISLGTKLIGDLRGLTELPFDVHLMMVDPEWILPKLVESGANRISVHFEACPYPRRVLRQIVSLGAEAGIAFNPATPIPDLVYLLPYLSFVVVLTTEPENQDCPFLPGILEKVRQGVATKGLKGIEWMVEGGIDEYNVAQVAEAGVDTVVVGQRIFKEGQIAQNMAALREALEKVSGDEQTGAELLNGEQQIGLGEKPE